MTVIKVDGSFMHVQGDAAERKFDLKLSGQIHMLKFSDKRKVSKIEPKKSIFCSLCGRLKATLILSISLVIVPM